MGAPKHTLKEREETKCVETKYKNVPDGNLSPLIWEGKINPVLNDKTGKKSDSGNSGVSVSENVVII